jgi:1-acyl-sn-glycerol-3-phosphate acyltransferase
MTERSPVAENPEGERLEGSPLSAGASHKKLFSDQHNFLSRLRSYFFIDLLLWFYTIVFGLVSIPFGFFDRDGRILHAFARAWSKAIMKSIFSPMKVSGLDRIDTSKPIVYAVNHASALDIPALYAFLPFQFRILFKSELLSYPIIGWHLKRSGQICINQQQPSRSAGSIRTALKGLKAGMPLVIFPEGGRTPDGEIKPFLPGTFFLAIKAQVEIVPIALVGTFDLLPMNTYHIKCRRLEMRVGKPISTAGLTLRDMDDVSARVQKELEDLYLADRSLAEKTLRAGARILDPIMNSHGFCFVFQHSGKGSGGNFASGYFVNGERRLEFHFRYTLGLVTYYIGDNSLDHGQYMRLLGAHAAYPDFPKEPLDSFRSLASDLENYCSDFLAGDGTQFLRFIAEMKDNYRKSFKLPQ